MPCIEVKTNVKTTEKQAEQIKEQLGKAISMIPGKSESWLMVIVEDEKQIYFQGDGQKPAAFVQVMIYGRANKNAFEQLTGEITRILGEIGITPDRIYVKYEQVEYWGWNGSNF